MKSRCQIELYLSYPVCLRCLVREMFDLLVNLTQGPRIDATKMTISFLYIYLFHSSGDTCLPGEYSNTTVCRRSSHESPALNSQQTMLRIVVLSKSLMETKRSHIWRTYENKREEKNVLDLSKTNAFWYTKPNRKFISFSYIV